MRCTSHFYLVAASCVLLMLVACVSVGAEANKDEIYKSISTGPERERLKQLDKFAARKMSAADRAAHLIPAIQEASGDVHGSTIRMVQMLGQINDRSAEAGLLNLLSAPDFRLVMPAIDALGERKNPAHLEALEACDKRPEFANLYGFRNCLFAAMANIKDRRSLDFFFRHLPEIDGRLKFDAVVHLSQTTDENLGSNAAAWTAWWRDYRDDFDFAKVHSTLTVDDILLAYQVEDFGDVSSSAEFEIEATPVKIEAPPVLAVAKTKAQRRKDARTGAQWQILSGEMLADFHPRIDPLAKLGFGGRELKPIPQGIPKFFNVPILGKRIVFVIDRSKSMEEALNGERKIDKAKKQLIGAISGLPRNTKFNMVRFDNSVVQWEQNLQLASKANKTRTSEAVMELGTAGFTDVYDAMIRGLEQNENLEAIYLLSDGEPNVGTIPEPHAIVEALTQLNFLRRVQIHTIGIDANKPAEEFLIALAARNHGTYTAVR